MKKILIFTDTFLPGFKAGGPITSIYNFVNLLNQNFEILVCTKNRDLGEAEPYKGINYNSITKYEEYNVIYLTALNYRSIAGTIKEFNPDLLYLNSFFSTTSQIVLFLNKIMFHKRVLLAPRGELQENALKIKKDKKRYYLFFYKLFKFYNNVYFHTTDTTETSQVEKMFNIKSIIELKNMVKLERYEPLEKNKDELRIIFVSRILKNKNLHFVLNILSTIKYPIILDIYGPKEDLSYWEKCFEITESLPNNIKVGYNGILKQKEVILIMRNYHVFFFPTETENFGHVIVEAMQAGLVPIISNQTPWVNLEEQEAGWDIPLSNEKLYIKVIIEMYKMNAKEYTQLSSNVIRYINKKLNILELKEKYVTELTQIIQEDGVTGV